MPTVLRWKGHRFFFWSGDRDEPPHVHVDHASKSVKIWLETMKVAYNDGYALHEVNAILNVVERDRKQLLRAWHEHFGD